MGLIGQDVQLIATHYNAHLAFSSLGVCRTGEGLMRAIVAVVAISIAVSSCTGLNQPTEQVLAAPKRDLTPLEKTSLTRVLAQSLKDPDAAKFKWMPVVLAERDGITDYCGLVNGKNSYGGYTGFVRFYAQLKKDEKGQFTTAFMRSIEESNREINPIDPRWLNGICEKFGYSDFGLAS
jgi:hypothetical protein